MQFLEQFIELYHINRMQFLGQTFSLIGALFIAYSVFGKNKKNIVILQLCTNIFCTLTNIFLRSYSGVVANAILSIRHFLDIKGKMTADKKKQQFFFIKPLSDEAEQLILSMDFNALAERNTATPGFGKGDFVSYYTELKES